MARRGHVPTKVERSLYRGITGITGITGTSNTGNTDHKYSTCAYVNNSEQQQQQQQK